MSVGSTGDFKQMYNCLANEPLMDSVLDSNFRIFVLLVYKSVGAAGDFKQMYNCLAKILFLIQTLGFLSFCSFGLYECVRLVI